jgi:hypothetical protein
MVYDNDSAVASKEAAGAPEREIEVTPEMIAAGSETLALFRQSEDSSEVRLFYQPYIYIHYAGHKNLSGRAHVVLG